MFNKSPFSLLFITVSLCLNLIVPKPSFCQTKLELSSNWKAVPIELEPNDGKVISKASYKNRAWKDAVVPGTVLTTMLHNQEIPDPFFGMNNEEIPDIYHIGSKHYTYWFIHDFRQEALPDKELWLTFRGINYSCNIYLNGQLVNQELYKGMYLRKSFNITKLLNKEGDNRLAVIVYPPDHVGNPNGGQGGDGTIAKNVGLQYTAGWDWIRPIRDRNTGIWDKVYLETSGAIRVEDPHIVTQVPGKRKANSRLQAPATINVSATLSNSSSKEIAGSVIYEIDGKKYRSQVTLKPNSKQLYNLAPIEIENPTLWWPSNYGDQHLYASTLQFVAEDGGVSDRKEINVGIREIQTGWNSTTRSKEVFVNGQRIFIKGANWIISDAMLRFSDARYDAEVRFHRDMNINLIRIWGGALVERPEFYDACDRYGLLVLQDFWMSGDCNGRWMDPKKAEDQWTRRQYPDDHQLFLHSAADMIKMIRNHPSLAIWCGGNEITPPDDLLYALRDSILPELDGTRWFIDYSNSDDMSYNFLGGNGDGPYGIQPIQTFWQDRTWPFNSEVGSVGVGDLQSLQRFLPKENQVAPQLIETADSEKPNEQVDSVWTYHTYIGYGKHLEPYGSVKDLEDFANKAQLVNYHQYRGLMEGFSSHMWEWYTGTIIWKTQNPWTSMRGQLYDYYLDPNAGLYGLRAGSEPLHAMYNETDGFIHLVNHHVEARNNVMLRVTAYDMEGRDSLLTQVFCYIEPGSTKKVLSLKRSVAALAAEKGLFLNLQLLNTDQEVLSSNFYWLPDARGTYSGLQTMKEAPLTATATEVKPGQFELVMDNPPNAPLAFFNRISLVDSKNGERILPTFYDENYISVIPGEKQRVMVTCDEKLLNNKTYHIAIQGWNTKEMVVPIR